MDARRSVRVASGREMSYCWGMTDAERLVEQALKLPEDDRTEIALRLLSSVDAYDPHADLSDEELRAELIARAESAEGGSPGRSWADVSQTVRARLNR